MKLKQHEKVELITKISILMMILPVPKIDEFIENNILLDNILQGSTWSNTITKTLGSTLMLDMKNDGLGYNYRVDLLLGFLMSAEQGLGKVPDRAGENRVTDVIKRRFAQDDHPELRYFKEPLKN